MTGVEAEVTSRDADEYFGTKRRWTIASGQVQERPSKRARCLDSGSGFLAQTWDESDGKFTAKELHTEKADGAMETPASYIGSASRKRIDSHEEIVDHFNRCAHIRAPPRRLTV